MDQQFSGLGIRFRYPDQWELTEELGETEAAITVMSPESAFWSATVIRNRPDPEAVMQQVLEVYREEYDELDISLGEASLANREVAAAEIDFVCLELTNSAFLRTFRTGGFTLLVVYQLTDEDLDEQLPVLEAISDSLICEADVGPLW